MSYDDAVSSDIGSVSVVVVVAVAAAVVGLGLRLSDCNHAQQLVLPDDREGLEIIQAKSTTVLWIGFHSMEQHTNRRA